MIADERIIIFVIITIIIAFCCLIQVILFIMIKIYAAEQKKSVEVEAEKQKQKIEETEKMLMRFLIIIGLLMAVCYGDPWLDEDEPSISIIDDKPMVFPDALPKAANVLADAIGDESDHLWFMSPGYWPAPLNNSSVMNLTA